MTNTIPFIRFNMLDDCLKKKSGNSSKRWQTYTALISMLILWVCLLASSAVAEDATQSAATGIQHEALIINASGFKHDGGQAVGNLFREGDDVLHKPYLRVAAKIMEGKATLVFPDLPYGAYAISVFHDENGNTQLDHNMLRLPAEPLGFSNGFKLGLFSGLPTFEKLRFTFVSGAKPVKITMR